MANNQTKELRDKHPYVTFDDVIAFALANTSVDKFFADSQKWQITLYSIYKKFKKTIPELESMSFSKSRSDIAPQSEQFYQLINILSSSRLISLPNPNFEYIVMDASQKKRVISLEKHLLKGYEHPISAISDILEKDLAVT